MAIVPIPSDSDFTLANLPYGVFRPRAGGAPRVGVALGEHVVDLAVLAEAGLLADTQLAPEVFRQGSLNGLLTHGRPAWTRLRQAVTTLLSAAGSPLAVDGVLRDEAVWPAAAIEPLLPVEIGDYTDFYASRYHASNVGAMLRDPDNPLLPNWLHLPVAYHGRASSIVVSGTPVQRPNGQVLRAGQVQVGPSQAVDFELEVGAIIGAGNVRGQPVPIDQAEDQVFGLVLVNDWSARDLQAWEYQPLGPFLAKNFATTISPWVVPLEALAPFRIPLADQDPEPVPYLRATTPLSIELGLTAELEAAAAGASGPMRLTVSDTRFSYLYWSLAQMIAHHTINGCNLRPGDLLATGTISGPTPESCGCLLERTWRGTRPLQLSDGQTRTYLSDGDRLTLRGHAGAGSQRVGFGDCSGQLLAGLAL